VNIDFNAMFKANLLLVDWKRTTNITFAINILSKANQVLANPTYIHHWFRYRAEIVDARWTRWSEYSSSTSRLLFVVWRSRPFPFKKERVGYFKRLTSKGTALLRERMGVMQCETGRRAPILRQHKSLSTLHPHTHLFARPRCSTHASRYTNHTQ